jgi:tetratricopeptide (TPR) repeat protein
MNAGLGFILLVALLPVSHVGQVEQARHLFEAGRWEELLREFEPRPGDPADLNYYRGMAFARLQRWTQALGEFSTGRRKSPRDARFPLELAGVAFRQNRRGEALALIRAALRLDPTDRYANDFAGTLFLLERNPRAAIKFWNRIGKPQIREIRSTPEPPLDPVLLDRAFTLRPASVASLHDYDSTLLRLRFLEAFQSADLELVPTQDEKFELVFRNVPRTGFGSRVVPAMLKLLSGIPFATAYPEAVNIRHAAVNVVSMVRWDPRKRRVAVSASGPPGSAPGRRLTFDFDARSEEWDVSRAVHGVYAGARAFSLERIGAGLTFGATAGTWVIETGGSVARTDYSVTNGGAEPEFLRDGVSLKYRFGVQKNLYSVPDHGLDVKGRASLDAGKLFGAGRFGDTAAELHVQWRPAAGRASHALSGRVLAGAVSKNAPFYEFFSFGLERDNDVYLRGHGGTDGGRKGRGPLGTRYLLASCELDKTLANTGLWRLSAGPFLDSGRIYDAHGVFGSGRWLYDTGIQVRVSVMNTLDVTLSFGKDLRSGGHALFVNTSSARE